MTSPTKSRDTVASIAKTDTDRALELAQAIDDPWFAAQALAHVARYAPPTRIVALARHSLRTAHRSSDPFAMCAASAWPIRALVETDHRPEASAELRALLPHVSAIAYPGSRAEALSLLFHAAFPGGTALREFVLHPRELTALLDVFDDKLRDKVARQKRPMQPRPFFF